MRSFDDLARKVHDLDLDGSAVLLLNDLEYDNISGQLGTMGRADKKLEASGFYNFIVSHVPVVPSGQVKPGNLRISNRKEFGKHV